MPHVLNPPGQALTELSKDKPANKQVEAHVTQFRQTLTNVETELAKQINYLTQVSTGVLQVEGWRAVCVCVCVLEEQEEVLCMFGGYMDKKWYRFFCVHFF